MASHVGSEIAAVSNGRPGKQLAVSGAGWGLGVELKSRKEETDIYLTLSI